MKVGGAEDIHTLGIVMELVNPSPEEADVVMESVCPVDDELGRNDRNQCACNEPKAITGKELDVLDWAGEKKGNAGGEANDDGYEDHALESPTGNLRKAPHWVHKLHQDQEEEHAQHAANCDLNNARRGKYTRAFGLEATLETGGARDCRE